MVFTIENSVAVKPDLIRFSVEVFEGAELVAEHEIVLHTNDYTTMNAQGGIMEMQIDLGELQSRITDEVTKMSVTAGVAAAINSQHLRWEVNTDEPAIPEGMHVAHGE